MRINAVILRRGFVACAVFAAVIQPALSFAWDGRGHGGGRRGFPRYEHRGPVIHYRAVIINGATYYTDGAAYYVYTPYGYRLVRPVRETVVVTERVPVCASPNRTKVAEGVTLGGVLGAVAGGIIGHQSGRGTGGALLGGAAGAIVGGIMGAQVSNEYVRR